MSAEPRFSTDARLTLVASSMSADPRARRRPPKARPGERADSGRPARDRPSGLHFRLLEGQPCAVANVARTDYASWPKDASPGTRPNRKPPACGHRASKESLARTPRRATMLAASRLPLLRGSTSRQAGEAPTSLPRHISPQQWLEPLTWVQLLCRRRGAVFTPSGGCRVRRSGIVPMLSRAARLDIDQCGPARRSEAGRSASGQRLSASAAPSRGAPHQSPNGAPASALLEWQTGRLQGGSQKDR